MGIESDQIVFDYLSRVGDLAQQGQLASGTRMRLVTELRGEIARQRSKSGADNPAAVNRILRRIGSPAQIVEAAKTDGTTDGTSYGADPGRAATPGGATGAPDGGSQDPAPSGVPPQRLPDGAASSPRPAGTDELRPGPQDGSPPDWWRVEATPFGPGESVPGFIGGIEIPEMLRPPLTEKEKAAAKAAATADADKAAGKTAAKKGGLPRALLRRVLKRPAPPDKSAPAPDPAPAPAAAAKPAVSLSPLLVLSAALLIAAAVLGSLPALGAGWLLAYVSRRLSRTEARIAVFWVPGTVAAGALVWLWGRLDGRWGDPIAQGGMADALSRTWPWTLRTAAIASALYLLWRARRPRA